MCDHSAACNPHRHIRHSSVHSLVHCLQVDIWAAGVIAYILLCGFPPFISNDQEELFEQILAGDMSFPSPYWDHVSQMPCHLIMAMVRVDSSERYTADQVLEHPWITVSYAHPRQQLNIITATLVAQQHHLCIVCGVTYV